MPTTKPSPVDVTNTDPIPVTVAEPAADTTARTVAAKAGVDAAVLSTGGQRRINLIWELTQALVAMSVTVTTLFVSARLAVEGQADSASFLLLSNAFFLVIGFYFGRTNHTRVGGVGQNEVGR